MSNLISLKKRRSGWPNLKWKDGCKRGVTEAGLREDTLHNKQEGMEK